MPVTSVVSGEAKTLQDAQDQLSPSKSLDRVNDNAKFLAGSLSLVGTLLTAAGLLSADRLRVNASAAFFATVAVVLATAAVVVAVICLVLRERQVHVQNLVEVKAWYDWQLGKAFWLARAGRALVAAIVLGGIAAGIVIFASPEPSMSLQFGGQGSNAKLSEKVGVQGLVPGTRVETAVTGYDTNSRPFVLERSVTTADSTGTVDFSADIAQPGDYVRYTLRVVIGGSQTPFTLELRT